MEFENFNCFFFDFLRYSFGRRKVFSTVVERARRLAKHVCGSYRIVADFIPNRLFVPIRTIYLKNQSSTVLRGGSFSKKNIGKKHLCHHDKNYYYFCKSNISVSNFIAGFENTIKLSKNMTL